jgi:hypothetical protein
MDEQNYIQLPELQKVDTRALQLAQRADQMLTEARLKDAAEAPHPEWRFDEEELTAYQEVRQEIKPSTLVDAWQQRRDDQIADGMPYTIDLNAPPPEVPEETRERKAMEQRAMTEKMTERWQDFVGTVCSDLGLEYEITEISDDRLYIPWETHVRLPGERRLNIKPAWKYFDVELRMGGDGDYARHLIDLETLASIPGVRAEGHANPEIGRQWILDDSLGVPIQYRRDQRFHVDNSRGLYALVLGARELGAQG